MFIVCSSFVQFDLRNSSLRKKYDGLKYTLKKLEVGGISVVVKRYRHSD